VEGQDRGGRGVSAGDEESKAQEVVIIRRAHGGEEGAHKGGVWKIAYADFMTAMMAFFLVMWLINASDKQTVTQVATYFNPLRLTDKVALSKGVQHADPSMSSNETGPGGAKQSAGADKEVKEKSHAAAKAKAGPDKADGKTEGKAGGAKPTYTEEALFRDPYGVLSKLAKQATEDQSQPAKGGEAYRDPFDPVFRRESQAEKREPAKPVPTPSPAAPESVPGTPPAAADARRALDTQPPPAPTRPAQEPQVKVQDQEIQAKQAKDREQQAQKAKDREEQAKKAEDQGRERAAAAAKLERDIRDVVARAIAGALPNITVTVTEEGILISLTDDQNFGMFAIASAEPRPAMVVLMEKLGKVLVGYREPLIVRGHTDGRPYKSGTYDNWRLSTARAHMAYYMLVRAGIEEQRFERIEGHADRHLKVAGDPEAAQNRRIEILLRRPAS
jgi:chemotaxis protein MotB